MRITGVRIFFIVIAVIMTFGGATAGIFAYTEGIQRIQNKTIASLSTAGRINATRVTQLEGHVKLLVANNKTVQDQLAEEKQKRLQAEQSQKSQQAQAQKQISQLTKDLDASKSPDIAALVQNWRYRIGVIGCHFDFPNGTSNETQGSAVLLKTSPNYVLTTNRHVIMYQATKASFCSVRFPDDQETIVVQADDIHPSLNGADWATIDIKPSSILSSRKIDNALRCSRRASAGEGILILGYPTIGARDDVTATEGIVAGFEGNYYITSAKVEKGNSGGAALLTKEGCYIGTPTYVGAGQIETLARILDQSVIQ